MPTRTMNLGVLASHEGTTLQSLLDAVCDGRIQGRVVVVVSNNGDSRALRRARMAHVQAVHLSSKTHEDPAALDAAIRDVLVASDVDVVFLAGYMKKLGPLVLRAFEGRILNTHPALLPRFGGPGMYGDRVFEAVLAAGEAESGVSIHLVDAEYDTGAIVRQCRVPVFRGDSLDDLKARIQAREKEFVVETLGQIAKGEIRLVAGADVTRGSGGSMSMRPELVACFNRLNRMGSFDRDLFDDVNATNGDDENALHLVARRNELDTARLLIEAGINIDQYGDLGRTPLHEAASRGHRDMVLLLIESGADVHAHTEGDTPFYLARLKGHTEICEILGTAMTQKQEDVATKVKIELLRREIARLEKRLT